MGEVEDLSDNEREEQLRRFWAENWLWIVGGIALGAANLQYAWPVALAIDFRGE